MSELEISGNYTCIDNDNINNTKYINIKKITYNNNNKLDKTKIENIYVENKIKKHDDSYKNFDVKQYIDDIINKNLKNDFDNHLINDDMHSDKNSKNSLDNNFLDDDLYSDEYIEYILYNNNELYIKDKTKKDIRNYEKIIIIGMIIFVNYLAKAPKVLSLA